MEPASQQTNSLTGATRLQLGMAQQYRELGLTNEHAKVYKWAWALSARLVISIRRWTVVIFQFQIFLKNFSDVTKLLNQYDVNRGSFSSVHFRVGRPERREYLWPVRRSLIWRVPSLRGSWLCGFLPALDPCPRWPSKPELFPSHQSRFRPWTWTNLRPAELLWRRILR